MRTIMKILELQPNTIITEKLLETVSSKHSSIDEGVHLHAVLASVCLELSDDDPGNQKIAHQLSKRLSCLGLDENGMLEFIPRCTPTALVTVLSKTPDATATESVIKRLFQAILFRRGPRYPYPERAKSWFRDPKDEAFNMLLDRSDLPGPSRQLLLSEFQEVVKECNCD
ncbi:hypothetical protein BCON_0217g00130 [Botryotinia convoluta]|uniref:Uncharacterized protein n=1 Tax=Botryotinia convoluta TaxID=54673 RepID=A0A4Z1HPI9_9HELO|nr:hypothetical protein BCON_0217g00130 [Botryotinia convoluta]